MHYRTLVPLAAALGAGLAWTTGAFAAEATVSAVSGFPKGTYYSKQFESFVPDVNKGGKGVIKLNYKGGAPAIGSPFTLVQRIQKGVFGMVSITGAYYTNVLPESDAFKLTEISVQEQRKRGAIAYMDKLHQEKGLKYLSRQIENIPFHLYINKKITKPDLTGLHLRVAPIYTNFFKKLGGTTQRSNITQVYTYMENGTVVGFGWPIAGFLPDWHKVTKYRVDPGFYTADIHILMNLAHWNKLSKSQKGYLQAKLVAWEAKNDMWKAEARKARGQQTKDGIKSIGFSPADSKKWLTAAKDAGWEGVMRVSPKHGAKLKQLFTK